MALKINYILLFMLIFVVVFSSCTPNESSFDDRYGVESGDYDDNLGGEFDSDFSDVDDLFEKDFSKSCDSYRDIEDNLFYDTCTEGYSCYDYMSGGMSAEELMPEFEGYCSNYNVCCGSYDYVKKLAVVERAEMEREAEKEAEKQQEDAKLLESDKYYSYDDLFSVLNPIIPSGCRDPVIKKDNGSTDEITDINGDTYLVKYVTYTLSCDLDINGNHISEEVYKFCIEDAGEDNKGLIETEGVFCNPSVMSMGDDKEPVVTKSGESFRKVLLDNSGFLQYYYRDPSKRYFISFVTGVAYGDGGDNHYSISDFDSIVNEMDLSSLN